MGVLVFVAVGCVCRKNAGSDVLSNYEGQQEEGQKRSTILSDMLPMQNLECKVEEEA